MNINAVGELINFGITNQGRLDTPFPTHNVINKFQLLAENLFNQERTPILFSKDQPPGYQYSKFVIGERSGFQVVLDVSGGLMDNDVDPIEVTIRLWDKAANNIKRIKFTKHSVLNTVMVDACDELVVTPEISSALNSPKTAEVDRNFMWSPAVYSSDFINHVNEAMNGSKVNLELCKQAIKNGLDKEQFSLL
jgi:hypothetical protein